MKRILKWIVRIVLVLLILGFTWGFISYWRSTNECEKQTSNPANPMKAIVYCDYGLKNLKLAEIEKPAPNDDQILVKIHAVSVNPYDWHFVEGTPYVMRAFGVGLRKPKDIRLGVDFAGTVEAVGKDVTQFKPGDDVFGGRDGAFAQYVCRRGVGAVALKPAGLTFEQAASINIAGITALQGVRDKGKVQAGQKVLINGASGGVGTFAVQIAKSYGADVTGVCSSRNLEFVRSLGAGRVIDYTREDFTLDSERYDLLLDNVGNRTLWAMKRVLSPNGKCVMTGAPKELWRALIRVLKGFLWPPFLRQKFRFLVANINRDDLTSLGQLIKAGKVIPMIDKRYALTQASDAIAYV